VVLRIGTLLRWSVSGLLCLFFGIGLLASAEAAPGTPSSLLALPRFPLQLGLCRVVDIPVRTSLQAGESVHFSLRSGTDRVKVLPSGLQIRTPCLEDCVPNPDRFQGVVPVDPDCRAAIDGRVEIRTSDGQLRAFEDFKLAASIPLPGTAGIPVDARIHVAGPATQSAWFWTVEPARYAGPELAPLENATDRVVRVQTYIPDAYDLVEHFSGFRVRLHSGEQRLPYGMCAGSGCHNAEVAGWRQTAHATAFSRSMLGMRGQFSDQCLGCHVTGFTPGVSDRGFDDEMNDHGWRVPTTLSSAALEAMPTTLKVLAQVGCPSCHGPGKFTPANLSDTLCGTCHDAPPRYPKVAVWRTTGMAHAGSLLQEGDPLVCRACHTTRGFLAWQSRQIDAQVFPQKPDDGISCVACHDPHEAERYLIRSQLSSPGFSDVAGDRLCTSCHRLLMPDFVRQHDGTAHLVSGPMDTSFQTVRGSWPAQLAASDQDVPAAPHRSLTCVRCHDDRGDHAFGPKARGDQIRKCKDCHPNIKPPRIAAVQRPELPAGIRACEQLVVPARVAVRRGVIVFMDAQNQILGDCNGNGRPDPGERFAAPKNATAWWPFLIVSGDKSHGNHDPWLSQRFESTNP